jgi:endo-alpha-1,4-polygalactosaminidase (GH114 family)
VFKNYDHKAIVPPDSTDDAEHSSNLICEHLSSEKFEELFSLERSEDRYLERNRTSKEEIEMTKANSAILAELDFLSDEEEEEEDNPEQRRKLERKKRRQSGIFTRDFSLVGEVEKEKPVSQDYVSEDKCADSDVTHKGERRKTSLGLEEEQNEPAAG